MSPRPVILIAMLAAATGFTAGWLGRPRAPVSDQDTNSARHDGSRKAGSGGPSGDESPRRATRTYRPNRGDPPEPATDHRSLRGPRLSSEIETLFTKGLGDTWMDSLAWSAIQGSLVDADADDALHTIDQIQDMLANDDNSYDVGEIAGILIMHTAWMRLGELQGREALEALASEERWTAENNDGEPEIMLTAIVSGWARSDQAAARDWFEQTLSTESPDIHPNLREAAEDADFDDIRRMLGLTVDSGG